MYKTIAFLITFLLFQTKAWAEVVNDIKVINNDRISKETILIFSDIQIGKDYSQNDLNIILKEIYSTNFFSDVSIEIENGTLIIDVKENKIVQNITIEGLKKQELVNDLKKEYHQKIKIHSLKILSKMMFLILKNY